MSMDGFAVPDHVRPVRDAVHTFLTERVEPAEPVLHEGSAGERDAAGRLQDEAKAAGPVGARPPRRDRRRRPALPRLRLRERGHRPLASSARSRSARSRCRTRSCSTCTRTPSGATAICSRSSRGEIFPSFAMTEPDVASSDPTQLQTRAVLDGDEWVINGRKWFTTGADKAAYTTVMVRTEPDAPDHSAFSHDHRADRHARLQDRARDAGHGHPAVATARWPTTTSACRANLLGPRGARLPDRAAAPRARPHLPLHALARPGAARLRSDVRARQQRASRSASRSPRSSRSSSSSSSPPPRSRLPAC